MPSGNTHPTSIRLPLALIRALRELATLEALSYQTYLKMVLTRHVGNRQKAS
jgi:predicted DNA binding CopG/RHH family protein